MLPRAACVCVCVLLGVNKSVGAGEVRWHSTTGRTIITADTKQSLHDTHLLLGESELDTKHG